MKEIVAIFVLTFSSPAFCAEAWSPPRNIPTYCRELEAQIVSFYSYEIRSNQQFEKDKSAGEPYLENNDAKADQKERFDREREWNELRCDQILYRKD
jgi:hypothetical protein